MNLRAVGITTVAVALVLSGCTDSPTSPEGVRASSWTLTLDEAAIITSITVACRPDARQHICLATAEIQNGPPRDITQTTAVWKSSDITVATVGPTGVVTDVGLGQTTISAAAGGFIGSTTVVVVK